ncbi:hypothetical protein OF83DRAFT_1172586 [Amylostereum chailletii]|nr:hypothetical protein OF83DRAFT_1172586 [Amylostereum chailletii]
MSSVAIHTAFSVPVSASHPSINCLQWTADGQLLFLTKTDIYILTPDLGINIDTSSAISSAPTKGNTVARPLGWLKTIIAFDKRVYYHWPAVSQEWSTASLGSLDLSFRAVTASPSNLTADFG